MKILGYLLIHVLLAAVIGLGTAIYNWDKWLPRSGEGFEIYCILMSLSALVGLGVGIVACFCSDSK